VSGEIIRRKNGFYSLTDVIVVAEFVGGESEWGGKEKRKEENSSSMCLVE
jgi:hypothetical protein